jgi:hypothetical protein
MIERTPDDARVQLEWRRGEVYAITVDGNPLVRLASGVKRGYRIFRLVVAINEHVPEDVIDQLSRFAERGIEE